MELTPDFLDGYRAVRGSVALADEPELRCLRIEGPGAFDVLDAVCPCDVFLQDGQMKHTLLLSEDGIPFADVYACREGEHAYLLGYGPPMREMIQWIDANAAAADYSIVDLTESHRSFALDGPYAWEYCAEVVGPDVLGLPYLSMIVLGDVFVFRAGRTGEYGYHLLVPRDQESTWRDRLNEMGQAFDACWADDAARAQCVLENFFFDADREGRCGLSPMELQLQWRLSPQKTGYPGAEAIAALRESGWERRLTCIVSAEPMDAGEDVLCDDEEIGRVLAAGYSPLRGDYVGKALIRKPYWHAGLDFFEVGGSRIRTIAAPSIANLSLKVNPYRHSYRTREEDFA